MKYPIFTGVCTALVTPFLDDNINYPLLLQLLQRQIDAGIKCVVLAGTTGEAPTLTDDEKIKMFRICKEFAGSDCKIIAGTGSNNTRHALELSQKAQDAGVDGLLIVSPYYNKANQTGLYDHYALIAQSVDIPIIVYNVPGRTSVDIPISTYKELSEIPNVNGIKEAAVDIAKQGKTLAICSDSLNVWAGNDEHVIPNIALGGQGVISVISNINPIETNVMVQSAMAGDFRTAAMYQQQLNQLNSLLFADVNPIPVKYAMTKIGYDCGRCRLPLTEPSLELKEKITNFFN